MNKPDRVLTASSPLPQRRLDLLLIFTCAVWQLPPAAGQLACPRPSACGLVGDFTGSWAPAHHSPYLRGPAHTSLLREDRPAQVGSVL